MKEIVRIRFMAYPEWKQVNELAGSVEGWPPENCNHGRGKSLLFSRY